MSETTTETETEASSSDFWARIDRGDNITEMTRWAFSDGGPLAASGFELRTSQRELAMMVAERIDGGGWGLAEAPCGSGKGLAYLVPGMISALRTERRGWDEDDEPEGEREPGMEPDEDADEDGEPKLPRAVVVSTANIALQIQLLKKDVPGVAKALGVFVRSVLLKGRNNYACMRQVEDARLVLLQKPGGKVAQLLEWLDEPGCSGDKEDLTFDPGQDWGKVAIESGDCIGKKCKFYRRRIVDGVQVQCHSQRARAGLRSAHVVICNHHYLTLAGAMPSSLVAVDEAHELEGALRSALSRSINRGAGVATAKKVAKLAADAGAGEQLVEAIGAVFVGLNDRLGRLAKAIDVRPPGTITLEPGWLQDEEANSYIERYDAALTIAESIISSSHADEEELEAAGKAFAKLADLREYVAAIVDGIPTEAMLGAAPGEWALWVGVERTRGEDLRVSANVAPANVAPATLGLKKRYPRGVLVSATLAVDGGFTPLKVALGLVDPEEPEAELVLPSPFPLAKQGVLVVPSGPAPKDRDWEDWAAQQVVETVRQAQGRTLILCSSLRAVDRYSKALTASGLPYPHRRQGEAGREQLRAWFKECVEGVLIASRSFFQGLDVQGEACSCVVVDRVPFAPPGDPLEEAVGKLLEARGDGASAFDLRSLPQACQAMAQGAGRLIRSSTDRGVVVVLDSRVIGRGGMSRALRAALPPFPVSTDIRDVGNFLDGRPLAGTPKPSGASLRRGRG